MASLSLELQPFPIPHEVVIKLPSSGRREDGIKVGPPPTLALSTLSEETLSILCEEFTAAVFAAAGKSL